jgi:hypothetical protein
MLDVFRELAFLCFGTVARLSTALQQPDLAGGIGYVVAFWVLVA